jgi:hypothetical protein
MQNTVCIANSTVLGKFNVLTNTKPKVFSRIITRIRMKCVNSNLTSLASALLIKQEML